MLLILLATGCQGESFHQQIGWQAEDYFDEPEVIALCEANDLAAMQQAINAEGNRTARFIDNNSDNLPNAGDTDWTEYEWDHRNRLKQVTHKDTSGAITETVKYDYDYLNQLVYREHDTDGDQGSAAEERTYYVHHEGQVVLQFEKTGSGDFTAQDLAHRYMWGPAVDQLLADDTIDLVNGDQTLWALTDHLGTVRDLVDASGSISAGRRPNKLTSSR